MIIRGLETQLNSLYAENIIIFNLLLFPYILIIIFIFRLFIKDFGLNKNLQYTKLIGIFLTYQIFGYG